MADDLIGKSAVQETCVTGIRGLKVFFSDKQEKGHFAADGAEVRFNRASRVFSCSVPIIPEGLVLIVDVVALAK